MTEHEMIDRLEAAADDARDTISLPPRLMARVLADATAAQLAMNPSAGVVVMRAAEGKPARPLWTWVSGGALAASALLGVALGYGATGTLLSVPGLGDIVAGYFNTSASADDIGALATFLAEG